MGNAYLISGNLSLLPDGTFGFLLLYPFARPVIPVSAERVIYPESSTFPRAP